MTENYVGKVVSGRYKTAGRIAIGNVMLEVTAHLAIADRFGTKYPYLFGTRLDAGREGNIALMRVDRFKPDTMKAVEATAFKPIEGVDKSEWFVTPPGHGDSFAYVERVQDPIDQAWAVQLGAKPLADYVVAA